MTEKEFMVLFEKGDYDGQYADYIMEWSPGDRVICNGDMLTEAMEDGYLLDAFVNHMLESMESANV